MLNSIVKAFIACIPNVLKKLTLWVIELALTSRKNSINSPSKISDLASSLQKCSAILCEINSCKEIFLNILNKNASCSKLSPSVDDLTEYKIKKLINDIRNFTSSNLEQKESMCAEIGELINVLEIGLFFENIGNPDSCTTYLLILHLIESKIKIFN